jgi:hypothetical protein
MTKFETNWTNDIWINDIQWPHFAHMFPVWPLEVVIPSWAHLMFQSAQTWCPSLNGFPLRNQAKILWSELGHFRNQNLDTVSLVTIKISDFCPFSRPFFVLGAHLWRTVHGLLHDHKEVARWHPSMGHRVGFWRMTLADWVEANGYPTSWRKRLVECYCRYINTM